MNVRTIYKIFPKILCASLLFGSSLMNTATAQEAPSTTLGFDDSSVHTYTLDNGLTILVKPDQRAPVVLTQIWYKVGSTYEPNGITGISHMLEHMMFKGTTDLKPGDIETLVEASGGSQNAFTSYDYTAYYQFWGKDNLKLSFEIEASRMNNLILDQDLFDKEKQVVMEERRMRTEDNPIAFAQERFLASAYIANPRHHPVIGWMGDIEQYQLSDLKEWYKKWYTPNNAIIVVAGDVDPETVHQEALNYFGHLEKRTTPTLKKHPEIEAVGEKYLKVNHPNVEVPTLFMGYTTPSVNSIESKDIYALIVLETIIGGNETSRLQENLVRNHEIATGISANYDPFALDNVLFTILALPNQGHSLQELQDGINQQIKSVITDGVSSEELERVKTNVLAGKIYMMDSIPSQAMMMGSFASLGLPTNFEKTLLDEIQKVSAKEVQDIAKKYLTSDNLTVARLELPASVQTKEASTITNIPMPNQNTSVSNTGDNNE